MLTPPMADFLSCQQLASTSHFKERNYFSKLTQRRNAAGRPQVLDALGSRPGLFSPRHDVPEFVYVLGYRVYWQLFFFSSPRSPACMDIGLVHAEHDDHTSPSDPRQSLCLNDQPAFVWLIEQLGESSRNAVPFMG